jgi:hypothetical protein
MDTHLVLLISNVFALVVGVLLGKLKFEPKNGGEEVVSKHGDHTSQGEKASGKWRSWFRKNGLALVIAFMALVSVGMTAYNTNEQRHAFERQQECNNTINQSIAYRSRISDQDSQLNIDRGKNTANFNINFGRLAVESGSTQNDPEKREKARQEFAELYRSYLAEEQRISSQLESNLDDRKSRPVPTINCEDQ